MDDSVLQLLERELSEHTAIAPLESGGQGFVFRAYHEPTERNVAIKVLPDALLATKQQRDRFERETAITARLRHPNIVRLYGCGVVGDRPYYTMEYIEGLPIDDYIEAHDLDVRQTVKLFVKACRAVAYAHFEQVIHRDIKPSNIMVDGDGEPHLLDFGLAKDSWRDGGLTTIAGPLLGTLPFLSPEQAGGLDGRADTRSDVYALGVTLFRLLTGLFPYPVEGEASEVRRNIMECRPVPLRKALEFEHEGRRQGVRQANRDLEAIVGKVLAKEKEERYQSAAALADDLERYLRGDVVEARAAQRWYLLRRTVRRHRVAVSAAVLLLIVLVISTVGMTSLWFQANEQRRISSRTARLGLNALDKIVTEIDTEIRPLAGGTKVRDRLLKDVPDALQELSVLVEADAELRDIATALHEKRGDLASTKGNDSEAAEHYAAFLAALGPDCDRQTLARAHRKLAMVTEGNAAGHFQKAIDLAEGSERCIAYIEYGRHLYLAGDYEGAAERFAKAIEAAGDDRALLASAYDSRGESLTKLGQYDKAVQVLLEAVRLLDELVDEHPTNAELRYGLALARTRLGDAYGDGGDTALAKQWYEGAVSVYDYLTPMDPSVAEWKRSLSSVHSRLGRLANAAKEFAEAEGHLQTAMRLTRELVAADSENADFQRALGFAHTTLGELESAQGNNEAAYQHYTDGLAVRRTLLARDQSCVAYRMDVAMSHNRLAACCMNLERTTEEETHYAEAYRIRSEVCEEQPGVLEYALDMLNAQLNYAGWHYRQKTATGDAEGMKLVAGADARLVELEEEGRVSPALPRFQQLRKALREYQRRFENRSRP